MQLREFSIFDMKVFGFLHFKESTTYKMNVGPMEDRDLEIIIPAAEHVKTSICPGVSITVKLNIRYKIENNAINVFICH